MAEREDAEVCGVGFPACPSVAIGSTGDMRWTRGVGLRRGYEVYMARYGGAMDACALLCSDPASDWKPELRDGERYTRECYALGGLGDEKGEVAEYGSRVLRVSAPPLPGA